MPEKTRKEKLMAELRRKMAAVNPNQSSISSTINKPDKQMPNLKEVGETNFSFQFRSVSGTQSQARPTSLSNNYSFVYKDLSRTLVFSLLAIAIQFVLVFLLRTK